MIVEKWICGTAWDGKVHVIKVTVKETALVSKIIDDTSETNQILHYHRQFKGERRKRLHDTREAALLAFMQTASSVIGGLQDQIAQKEKQIAQAKELLCTTA